MGNTEIILGATRALEIITCLLIIALSSSSIDGLPPNSPAYATPTRYALFVGLYQFLGLLFLIASQFLFVRRYDGYSTYLSIASILEITIWISTFASWIAIAQLGYSCQSGRTCILNRPLLGFIFIDWLIWSTSLIIIIRLKVNDMRSIKETKEIERRIKSAVENTTQ